MATNNFSSRRARILSTFEQATTELGQLNADIDKTIEANTNEIADRQAENKELETLKTRKNQDCKIFLKTIKSIK